MSEQYVMGINTSPALGSGDQIKLQKDHDRLSWIKKKTQGYVKVTKKKKKKALTDDGTGMRFVWPP